MEKKTSLKVYFEETETYYKRLEAVIVNEDTHPELKGMSEEEMVKYVQENIESMNAVDSESSANLEEQVMYADQDWDRFYPYSTKTVVEVLKDEDSGEGDDGDDESGDD